MKQSVLDLQQEVNQTLGADLLSSEIALDELTIEVSVEKALEAFTKLRDELGFEQLIDLCGVDYLDYGQANWETMKAVNSGFSRGVFDFAEDESDDEQQMERRFAVVYHLLSIEHNRRVRVKVFPSEAAMPIVDSVISIWNCANWFEREAFDMFGIIFKGHPDLRRILTDYGFVGHPLRKDFPLTGHVEMRYDAEKGRVVYEPVSIENRVNVPRVIRKKSSPQTV
ncbi:MULTISPECIES: NADH-quinone oxidoreductase subunit C [Thiomicrorhabdus]|uniref:NADH-quinone oxidoreductase subunit C n=1 Tax=Thiomicrorhabdus heinhorstiae TaxID=2748010 RepID=A0ABS0BTZ8_9GAMM|nr:MULTISPECIES: NADH-quinone oxidoreductase subunit C [Thiomicrorhabdus]MBF6057289.1 NADH-quinone oxidoreductase subunit C [Thiomicrorhabdus heinhorstiae]